MSAAIRIKLFLQDIFTYRVNTQIHFQLHYQSHYSPIKYQTIMNIFVRVMHL